MADVGDVTGSRALGKAFATVMPPSSELDLNSSNTGYQKSCILILGATSLKGLELARIFEPETFFGEAYRSKGRHGGVAFRAAGSALQNLG